MLTGDFNADINRIQACQKLLEQGWIDLGNVAEIWGKQNREATCFTPNSKTGSRIDYMLVSPELFGIIEHLDMNHTMARM